MRYWLLKLFCLAVLGLLATAGSAAADTTYNVDTTLDTPAVNPAVSCSDSSGHCSLRSSIQAANVLGAGNVIINVPTGTYALSRPPSGFSPDDSTGDLDITYTGGTVTLVGAGQGSTIIDGNAIDRVLHTAFNSTVIVSGVTIRNGRPGGLGNVSTCPGSPTAGFAPGGGVFDEGTLTLTDVTISGNISAGDGGGIADQGNALTLTRVTLSGNQACQSSTPAADGPGFGGGLEDFSGTPVNINLSTIAGNSAASDGGGLAEITGSSEGGGGTLNVTDSTISANSAHSSGGGVAGEGGIGAIHLLRDTLVGNQATTGDGGAVGGSDNVTVINSTVTGNAATGGGSGGGIGQGAGSLTISFSTINANTATTGSGGNISSGEATVTLDDSIVSAGIADGSANNCSGGISSAGHNLFDDNGQACGAISSDLTNTNPHLDPLANNGGPTQTEAIHVPGSPTPSAAVDAADDTRCSTETGPAPALGLASAAVRDAVISGPVDQRGVARPQLTHCDIGAYEAQDIPDVALAASIAPGSINTGGTAQLTETVTDTGQAAAGGTTLTVTLPAGLTATSLAGGCQAAGAAITCALGTVSPGAPRTLSFTVRGASAGTFTIPAHVTFSASDPTPADDSASVQLSVRPPTPNPKADLAVTEHAWPASLTVGDQTTFTVTVKNLGPNAASTPTLVVTLPSGVRLTGSLARGCHGSTTVTCHLATLSNGHSTTIRLRVTVRRPGRETSNARVSSSTPDPNLANNHASASISAQALLCATAYTFSTSYDADDAVDPVQVKLNGHLVKTVHGHNVRTVRVSGLKTGHRYAVWVRFVLLFRGKPYHFVTETATINNCRLGAVHTTLSGHPEPKTERH